MAKILFIKPRDGMKVPDPVTGKPLAKDGETKPDTAYWRRRLKDKDVVLSDDYDDGDDQS